MIYALTHEQSTGHLGACPMKRVNHASSNSLNTLKNMTHEVELFNDTEVACGRAGHRFCTKRFYFTAA
mgnify:CR=1 FL=1